MGKYAIFIVSALIFSLLTYSSALRNALFMSGTRTIESHSTNQAYNIAQSAVMVVTKDIIEEGDDSSFYPDEDESYSYPSVNGFEDWEDMHGSYNVVTTNQGDTLLTIQATGRFDGSRYIVGVGLVKSSTSSSFPWPGINSAIHSVENTVIENGAVHGDIYSGGAFSIPANAQVYGDVAVIPNQVNAVEIHSGGIHGNLYVNTTQADGVNYTNWGASISGNLLVGPGADPELVAPKISQWHGGHVGGSQGNLSEPIPEEIMELPVFPQIPQSGTSLSPITIEGNSSQYLDLRSSNAMVPSITIKSNTTLTIEVGDKDRTLYVGDLDIEQGHVNIISEGEGRLQLLVEDSFNMGGSSSMNNNSNPGGNERSPLSLLLAYAGTNEFTIGGAQTINANFYIKDADLTMTGSGNIHGNVISGGDNVTITGDADNTSRVVYAPNAFVEMGGSGKIEGSVVSKNFRGYGGFSVIYSEEYIDTLPDLDTDGGGGGESTFSVSYWN